MANVTHQSQARPGGEGSDPATPAPASSSSSEVHVAEVLLIQDIGAADGTTTARFYANPSARSLPGPKLPEYHSKAPESPVSSPQGEGQGWNVGIEGGGQSAITREEGNHNVGGAPPGKVGFPERGFKRFIEAHINADDDDLQQEEHAGKGNLDDVRIII